MYIFNFLLSCVYASTILFGDIDKESTVIGEICVFVLYVWLLLQMTACCIFYGSRSLL